jgi:hypothetical protein
VVGYNYERGHTMAKKRYTPEQIIEKLREADYRHSSRIMLKQLLKPGGVLML